MVEFCLNLVELLKGIFGVIGCVVIFNRVFYCFVVRLRLAVGVTFWISFCSFMLKVNEGFFVIQK